MSTASDLEEQRVERLLAPLQQVRPVTRPARARPSKGRGRRLVLLAAAVLAIGVGVAAVRAVLPSRQQATRSPLSQGGPFACQGLEGMPDGSAAAYFAHRGLSVSWRLTRYVDPTTHDGIGAYASSPKTVPPDTIVEDVAFLNSTTVIVFVRSADDAFAPPLPSPGCQAHG
jgi:hypothetical protein